MFNRKNGLVDFHDIRKGDHIVWINEENRPDYWSEGGCIEVKTAYFDGSKVYIEFENGKRLSFETPQNHIAISKLAEFDKWHRGDKLRRKTMSRAFEEACLGAKIKPQTVMTVDRFARLRPTAQNPVPTPVMFVEGLEPWWHCHAPNWTKMKKRDLDATMGLSLSDILLLLAVSGAETRPGPSDEWTMNAPQPKQRTDYQTLVERPVVVMGTSKACRDIINLLMENPRQPRIIMLTSKHRLHDIAGLHLSQVLMTHDFYHVFDESDLAYAKSRVRCYVGS